MGSVCSQTDDRQSHFRAHFRIRYVVNIPEIDSAYLDNSARLADIRQFLQMVSEDSLMRIASIEFCGTASPEGGYENNVWLSETRLKTFKEFVHQCIDLPDSLIRANVSDIAWSGFRSAVEASDLRWRDEILAVASEEGVRVPWFRDRRGRQRTIDHRLLKLHRLHGGAVWQDIQTPILRDLRYGEAIFEFYRPRLAIPRPYTPDAVLPDLEMAGLELPPPIHRWIPHVRLKTNIVGLGLLMANAAVEADFAPHWSATLPVYYSAINYFKSTVKFRNLTFQPEVRWWPRLHSYAGLLHNDGFFLGAHAELCYYNFAFDGAYRYQDHRGHTPAIGGGLAVGWRHRIGGERGRWSLEYAVGAGIYPLDYDVFYNTPDVRDGQLADRRRETYIGLDQVAVTLGYRFDRTDAIRLLRRKGGGR